MLRILVAVTPLLIFTLIACDPKPVNNTPVKPIDDLSSEVSATPGDFGDTFIDAFIGDAANLIPFLSGDSASSGIQGYVYSSLLTVDKDNNFIPEMAKSWEVSEDQLTITFHLEEGIKWHDGAEFTSADLMFQYEMMIHPEVPSAYKEPFMQIEKAEAPDNLTFRVSYKEPYSPALSRISGMTGLPRHLLKDVKPADLIKSALSRKPVGTGPYVFGKWETQANITVKANKDFYKKDRPFIGSVITRVIPDLATQFLELKSGSIDMMGLDPIQYNRQTDSQYFKDNYRKYKYLANSYTYLGYNFKREIFRDKRVRQAMTYAIDKEEIIKGALLGLGRPATGPYKPGTWAYSDRVKRYPHNPEKAKELLAEVGWTDSDGDGILDKNGKKFTFEIVTNQGNSVRKKTAEIIQQRLKSVGIEVSIRVLEWSSFIENYINKRDFDATILGWSLGLDPDGYSIWHSSMTGEREFNFISYANAEVDELLEKGRRVFDKEKRKAFYQRFQEILAEDQPYTFLYNPEATPIVSARIEGIVPGAAGIGYNFDEWWVPKNNHLRESITAN